MRRIDVIVSALIGVVLAFTSIPPATQDLPLFVSAGASGAGSQMLRGEVEVDQYALFELRPDFEVPDGHKIVSRAWRIDGGDIRLVEDDMCMLGTGKPGKYKAEIAIQTAETYTVETPSGPREAILLPLVTHTQTWDIQIRGPPEPETPTEPETPEPAGPRNAVILYQLETAPPATGEAAAGLLRADGMQVVFSAASRDETPPTELATAYQAAFNAGLPALVVRDGNTVNRALKLPSETQAIIDEVKKP